MPANTNLGLQIEASVSGTQEIAQLEARINSLTATSETSSQRMAKATDLQTSSFQRLSQTSKSTFGSMSEDVENYGKSLGRIGTGIEGALGGFAHATKGALEFASAVGLGTRALAAHTSALGVMPCE